MSDSIDIIAHTPVLTECVRTAVSKALPFHRIRHIDPAAPGALDAHLERATAEPPYVLLLELNGAGDAEAFYSQFREAAPRVPVVVCTANPGPLVFMELKRMGSPPCLELPRDAASIPATIAGLAAPREDAGEDVPACPLVSFIPGKPGSGASTVVSHFAHASAALLGEPVALVDLDFNCGAQAFLSGRRQGLTLLDCVRHSERFNALPDPTSLAHAGSVDVFASADRSRRARLDLDAFERFLERLRAAYPLCLVDHSGNWERYSVSALQRSTAVFNVCSADPSSVAQARLALPLFEEASLLSRLRLVLNREACRKAVVAQEASVALGLKVAACLPNAFVEVQDAAVSGMLVASDSRFRAALYAFAHQELAALGLVDPPLATAAPASASRGLLASLGLAR